MPGTIGAVTGPMDSSPPEAAATPSPRRPTPRPTPSRTARPRRRPRSRGSCWPATPSPPRPARCSRAEPPASTSPTRGAARPTPSPSGWPAHPVAAVYASPIERTTQTAEAVAARHGLAVKALPGVIEADYGEWTGGKLAELAKTDLWKTVQRAPSRARFPGGESLAEMQTRMVAALEAVVADHPGELVVVVSHADPIKAAIAHYTGVHLDLFQRIVVSPASVTAFAFIGSRRRHVEVQRHRHPRRAPAAAARGQGAGEDDEKPEKKPAEGTTTPPGASEGKPSHA